MAGAGATVREALAAADAPESREIKNPYLAAALSFFFNGMGQAYNGQFTRGVLVLFGSLCGLFVLILPGIAIWLWGVADAYKTAKGMNEGTIPLRAADRFALVLFLVIWGATIVGLTALSAALLVWMGMQGMG
jgi:TM2 domain-containing membrane protein YozV